MHKNETKYTETMKVSWVSGHWYTERVVECSTAWSGFCSAADLRGRTPFYVVVNDSATAAVTLQLMMEIGDSGRQVIWPCFIKQQSCPTAALT